MSTDPITTIQAAFIGVQQEETFRAIFDAAPIGMALIDPDGTVLLHNNALRMITDYDAATLMRIGPVALTHPDDQPLTIKLRGELRAGLRDTYTQEKRVRHRSGHWVWVRVTVSAIRGSDRTLLRMISMVENITERKVTEAALRASEERFRALIHNANDIIAIMQPDGTRSYASPALQRTLGYPDDVELPAGNFDLVHPDDLPAIQVGVRECLRAPHTQVEIAYRLRAYDGSWSHFEAIITNLLDNEVIGGIVVNSRNVTARKEAEAQLLHWAFHDPVTALPNRQLFMDRTAQALGRARRTTGAVAVITVDLDRFKLINDSLGHRVGDELLAAVGARLLHAAREGDTVAHLGGDLFALLIEDLRDAGEALSIAERLRIALLCPFTAGEREVVVSVSLGIALSARGRHSAEDLLRDADRALSRAKELGKARCELFDAQSGAAAVERLELEQDLRRALDTDALHLHFQPQLDLRTGRLDGFEALVRWTDPRRGNVPPGQFIPVAEETGLILPLGRWMLTAACRQARCWARHDGGAPIVAVNLSVREFQHPDLPGDVARVLAETGLPPDRLQLEITESAAMQDIDGAIATLNGLRRLGVRLALDDFGTGHSSLSYLQRLPVDTLKLDRSFLDGTGRETMRGRAIIPAITALAHALDLTVIAEGIETVDHLNWVRASGCDWGQGYHISRPIPAEDIPPLLHAPRDEHSEALPPTRA
ncbi:MAG TPA: EAL domain-containing protein [Thermomicrobiales bacterium]|jgi:diguanylate cyclase (GGDEF)-like protein/PAS domain S-box-containing protein